MAHDTSPHLHLPNEILSSIFGKLTKADLKALRLVCHLWCALTTPGLFSRIYISSRSKDIEVFEQWIAKEECRLAVRELIYDASILLSTSRVSKYCHRLLAQLQISVKSIGTHYCGSDEINQLLNAVSQDELSRWPWDELTWTMEVQVVKEGFIAYSREYELQAANIKNDKHIVALTHGLQTLPGLKSIVMTDDYYYHACSEAEFNPLVANPLSQIETPFARCWNPMYLNPAPRSDEQGCYGEFEAYCLEYCRAVRVIFRHSNAEEISILPSSIQGCAVPAAYALPLPSKSLQDPSVFLTLRSLHLAIQLGYRTQIERGLEHLRSFLTAIPNLKILRLEFKGRRSDSDANVQACRFDRVFGSPPQFWPQLSVFALRLMSATSEELQEFLRRHSIRDLELEQIRLIKGEWATTFEWMHSTLFELEKVKFHRLYKDEKGHHAGEERTAGADLSAIEDYILNGGQNPLRMAG